MMDFQQAAVSIINQTVGKVFSATEHFTTSLLLPQLAPIFLLLLLTVFALIARKVLIFRRFLKEPSVLLELTPPALTEKTSYTTQQLFAVIHNLGAGKSLLAKLLGRKTLVSFEIVSSRNLGIRYLLRTTRKDANNIKRTLLSYLPQLEVKIVEEYLPEKTVWSEVFYTKVVEFKLKRHFAYPLEKKETLEEHDPVAYITGMMTKLLPDELISFQVVVCPTENKKTNRLSKMIINNENLLEYIDRPLLPVYLSMLILPVKLFLVILRKALGIVNWGISELVNGGNLKYQNQTETLRLKPERIANNFEKQIVDKVLHKINQPLFETSIRFLTIMKNPKDQNERIRGFVSSLSTFSVPKYQSLELKKSPFSFMENLRMFSFKKRLLSLVNNSGSSLLSVSEVSDLYHFPFMMVTQTENIVKVHSKQLPAPLSLKQERSLDVIFARNNYAGVTTMIGLSEEEREKHMYIIGATGSGKTTMIQSMVKQDIENGKGVAVIDPHGDLAESILSFIPDKRREDLIYVNPDDLKYPIGINLLELTKGMDEDDVLREKEFITESVISLFRKVFSESMGGHAHRIEYILRNTIQTALTLENPTLFTIYELLNNPPFQKKVTANLEDQNLSNFWKYEYGKAGDYQKVKMISPVASRIGRFLFSPSAKRILEQRKSTINFDEILDRRKILICNLAKGKLGEDTSEVLGIMIVAKIQLASLKRARVASLKRKPFYLYVDEFQNFATPSFIQMLSEARKYKTYLVMAEQSTSQQKDKNLVNVILANVGTVVSFRSANPDDEKLMLPQFSPFVEKGEIANLPRYHFYIKISAVDPEEAFSGETIPVEIAVRHEKIEKLIQSSRNLNAILYKKPPVIKTIKNTSSNANNSDKNSAAIDLSAL